MQDPVEELVRKLKKIVDEENQKRSQQKDGRGFPLKPITFSNKQLDEAGKLYELHQGGTTKAFLWGKDTHDNRLLARLIQEADASGVAIPLKVRAYVIRHFNSIVREVK
jgi:hypothetical protein